MGNATITDLLGNQYSGLTPLEIVERGLPSYTVELLVEVLDLTIDEVCRIIHVSRRTLARYRNRTLNPHLSDHILMVYNVYERTVEVMESSENAKIWLKNPNKVFRFRRPLDYLSSFAGSQEVLDELGRLQHGVFV